jgi:serine protease Do
MKIRLLAGWLAAFLPLSLTAQTSTNSAPASPIPAPTLGSAPALSPAPTLSPAATLKPAPALSEPTGKVAPPPGTINVAEEPIVKVIGNVMPAVVNIEAEGTAQSYENVRQFFGGYRILRDVPAQSIGSGMIISADGYVLTNAHVVELAEKEKEVSITLKSGSKYQAQIINADPDVDLALLKIEDKGAHVPFPYFDLTYVSPNLLGETVIAMGSPAGYQSSASHGILSAKGRNFTVEDHTYKNLLQTDAAINPGNSGGPLVDLNGSLVGINSAKLAGPAIENIGFAIPHDVVVPWVSDAIAVARGEKPAVTTVARASSLLDVVLHRLGIGLETLSGDEANELGFDGTGLIVNKVEQDSPAADANLRKGMIVTAFGNHPVSDEKSLPSELKNLQPGDDVRLQLVVFQHYAGFNLQRGGSVVLTAR